MNLNPVCNVAASRALHRPGSSTSTWLAVCIKTLLLKQEEMWGMSNIISCVRLCDLLMWRSRRRYIYQRYYAALSLEIFTGARRGELLAVRFKDLDWKNCSIRLVQQLVKVGSKHVIRELKSDSSQSRVIMVPAEVNEVLKVHRKSKKHEYEQLGFNDLEIKQMLTKGLVFTNEIGDSFSREISPELLRQH